jgi:membrane fusion protein
MSDLFRQEAIAHQQQKLHGSILLARPLSFSIITTIFSFVALGIVLFFVLFGFSRKEPVVGVLVPQQGLIRVFPQQAGVVIEKKVRDGEEVREGDILFVLSSERSSAQGETQSAISESLSSRITRIEAEVGQQKLQAKQQRAAMLRRKEELLSLLDQMEQEIKLQQRRVQLSESAAQRFEDLQRSNFISEAQVQDKAAESLDQQSRLRNLQRVRGSIRIDLAAVESDLKEHPLKVERETSMLERAASEIRQDLAESEARRQGFIRAPRSGYVTAISAEPGQQVLPSQSLAAVIPREGALEAELYAPTRAIGFVKPGSDVYIRYRAFPYQKFGQHHGKVREISRTAIQPHEIALPLARDPTSTDPLYRIRVVLDAQTVTAFGQDEALRAGMQLDASLVLEHRKLYEWVIEPLLSITGRL